MGDFSSITVAKGFTPMPEVGKRETYFQSKGIPGDGASAACVDGEIAEDGLFIASGDLWNPNLNGWIHLRGATYHSQWIVRFVRGYAVQVSPVAFDNIGYDAKYPEAALSLETWLPLDKDVPRTVNVIRETCDDGLCATVEHRTPFDFSEWMWDVCAIPGVRSGERRRGIEYEHPDDPAIPHRHSLEWLDSATTTAVCG